MVFQNPVTYKHVIEEMGSKIDCFIDFFHHPVTTMSAITHAYAYHYLLFQSATKTGL